MKKRNIGLAIFVLALFSVFGVLAYSNKLSGAGVVKAETVKASADVDQCLAVSSGVEVDDLAFDGKGSKVNITNTTGSDSFKIIVSGKLSGQYTLTPENNQSNPIVIDYSNAKGGTVVIRIELPNNSKCYNEIVINVPNQDDMYFDNTNLDMCNSWLSLETLYSGSLKEAVKEYSAAEKADLQSFMKTNLPYCTQSKVQYNYSESSLKSTMANLERIYYTNKSINSHSGNQSETVFEEDRSLYQEVADTKNGVALLQCKVNSTYLEPNELENPAIDVQATNVGDNASKSGPNLYLYKHTEEGDPISYTDTDGNSHQVCKVTCTEYVKVNFDPPQEVKAGLCFSYAVQVIAKTECNAEYNDSAIPKLKETCTPYPHCNEVRGHEDSAGPNEDFDACIEQCDGGKYTAACTNKCYTKVYEEKDSVTATKTALAQYAESVLASQMKERVDACPASAKDGGSWQAVYNYFQNNYTGHFTAQNGMIVYIPDDYPGCHWNGYAPYYFSSPALAQSTFASDVVNGGRYRPTNSSDKQTLGFRKNNGGCSNNCVWLGCSADAANVDPEKAMEDYNTNLERYNEAKVKCEASAKCESTEVTESIFTIGVDGDEDRWQESNDTQGTEYPEHNGAGCTNTTSPNNDRIIQGRDSNESTIIPGTGGLCYCGNEEYNDWHHYTRWTFPGSWYNVKTGKVTSTPPEEGREKYYNGGYNKYCVPYNNKEVNLGWMQEYYANNKDRSKSTVQPDEWNIHAKTQGFGKYDWTIAMECFYSVSNKEDICIDCEVDNTDTTTYSSEPESTSEKNIRIKAADTSNLLPAATGEEKVSYNWTDSGTKLDIEGYEITPGAYKEAVEEIGDNVFTDEYLDYEFTISGSDMAEIARKGDDYGVYDGDTVAIVGLEEKKANSLYAYRSTLIRNINSNSKIPKDEALKCNNIKNYKSTECDQFRNETVSAMYQTYLNAKNS